MKRLLSAAAVAAGLYAGPALAVDIEVGYPYSHLFDVTFEKVMKDFKKAHPDINVTFRATYENYEDGTNTVLRESVANSLPDISMLSVSWSVFEARTFKEAQTTSSTSLLGTNGGLPFT